MPSRRENPNPQYLQFTCFSEQYNTLMVAARGGVGTLSAASHQYFLNFIRDQPGVRSIKRGDSITYHVVFDSPAGKTLFLLKWGAPRGN